MLQQPNIITETLPFNSYIHNYLV